jgi:hypothetical protein
MSKNVTGLARVDSCARPNHPMIDRIWADRLPIVSLAVPFDRWSSRLACAAIDTLRKLRDKRGGPVSTDC